VKTVDTPLLRTLILLLSVERKVLLEMQGSLKAIYQVFAIYWKSGAEG